MPPTDPWLYIRCTVIKYDENGHCTETENDESIGPLFSGKRLVWKIEDKLKIKIENAVKFAEKVNTYKNLYRHIL